MLTEEGIVEMQRLRNKGFTLQEIADKYSVHLSTVSRHVKRGRRNYSHNRVDVYIYPNISKWLIKNNLTLRDAAKLMGIDTTTLNTVLLGTNRNPTKFVIDAILKVTGLTYEKAFREGCK